VSAEWLLPVGLLLGLGAWLHLMLCTSTYRRIP